MHWRGRKREEEGDGGEKKEKFLRRKKQRKGLPHPTSVEGRKKERKTGKLLSFLAARLPSPRTLRRYKRQRGEKKQGFSFEFRAP